MYWKDGILDTILLTLVIVNMNCLVAASNR